jgi:ornithine cyclodeaminase
VILAGANRPDAREADDDLMARATVYVDQRSACIERAGDLRIPLATGHLKIEQVANEIGTLFADTRGPRRTADVTVFKSMGVITQDLALGELVLARAIENGVGFDFDPNTGALQNPGRPAFAAATNNAIA